MLITIDQLEKIEIRIGKVIEAEKVPNADKLIRLVIDFGEYKRQILTAMAPFFDPSYFMNKEIPVIVNLEPRTLRGYESQGMIVAGDVDGKPVLLHPETTVPPGTRVI